MRAKELEQIVGKFNIQGNIESVKVLGDGFINDTYYVNTKGEETPDYLLQRKNKTIFTDIPSMMDNIQQIINHLKRRISMQGGDPLREAMTQIYTIDDKLYYLDENGEYWTICRFIEDSVTYEVADSPQLAFAGGKGIGKFQAMTADFEGSLTNILPGFHDMSYRFKQWDKVLEKDPVKRKTGLKEEIDWIEERRGEMLTFWKLVEDDVIPTRVTHNDTKINNILFDKQGKVLCVIDLDTVMSSTVLNDFGDAIRSYTNTGLEDDQDVEKISMDIEFFKAYSKGYLEEAKAFLSQTEMQYLAFSAKYITFEQVLRFLMDYIDGDNYYKIKYPDHNLVRTHAQFKLLRSMEFQYEEMKNIIKSM